MVSSVDRTTNGSKRLSRLVDPQQRETGPMIRRDNEGQEVV